ncbi:MAG: CHASE2 domain-containing protein [Chitinispirillales bacterium]|nr:CHASE2 domain-containing protein [Chitinispirillales bacterium]
MKALKKIPFVLAMSLLFAVIIAFFLHHVAVQLFDNLENATYDWRYSLKFEDMADDRYPDYGIHIVDIDERSMDKMGAYWNWDRGYQAKMVESLSSRFPASIAFDVLFYDYEDQRHRDRFSRALSLAYASDSTLQERIRGLDEILPAFINYDKQFEEAIIRSERVTLGLSLAEERDYLGFVSPQVARRMDMDWHNSLNPASALIFPDSLLEKIGFVKTIIDGIYPENAQAAKQIGHLNMASRDEVIREMVPLYRFGEFNTVYLPMSIRIAATLFGTPNEEIVFNPGQYIDIGKPFKIFKESNGEIRFSYPDFTKAQFMMIMADRDEIAALEEGERKVVSSYIALYRDDEGRTVLETRSGRISYELTEALLRSGDEAIAFDKMAIEDEIEIGGGYTVWRDSDVEWEISHDDGERYWLTANDIKTLTAIIPVLKDNDRTEADGGWLSLEEGQNRKLITFDFWVRREKGILVSSLPVLRAATLDELLTGGAEILETIEPNGRRDFGKSARIPLRRDNLHIITYFGRGSKPFPYFSFYDIMENNVNFPMEGRIFIVGSSSPALFDIKPAPHEKSYPAVEIHASILNSILTDTYVRRLTERQDLIALIFVGFAAALIAFLTKPFFGILIAGAALFAYMVGAFYIFDTKLIWIEMVRPMITIAAAFTAVMVYRYITEEKNRKFLHSTFKQYLSPELIDMMYTQKQKPQLGGDEGVLTAYFTDIAGFSTFSEKLGSPTKLVELLNEYLTAMTDILLSRHGTLDKYVGDAIIAFYGAPMHTPDHAAKACHTALDMQQKLDELRKKWTGEGDKWPEIVHDMQMRIGINTGTITTGNMGSAMRMNYTMMGDPVNLAARLESAAKYYGVFTIISEYTHDMIKDEFITRKLDMITVVGKSEPVTIHELIGRKNDKSTENLSALLNLYNQGIDHYYSRNWDKALECFTQADTLEPNRKSKTPKMLTPSQRYADMCKKYIDNPPEEDWDGVNRLTSK